jgi:SAM-dependent methyltransferase
LSNTDVTEFFGGWADRYDAAYDALDADGHALRARLNAVLRLVGPGPGRILDAGMGPGRLVWELDRAGWTVSGVDSTAEMVAIARQRLPGTRGRLAVAEIDQLPFPDDAFDAIVATGVLEYSGPERSLRELARVLRADGRAVVSYPNPTALYGIWKTRVFYPLVRAAKRACRRDLIGLPRGAPIVRPAAFERLLEDAGLSPEERVYTSYLPTISPLDAALPRLTARIGERLENSGDRLGRLLATQVVFAARKR